MCARSASCSTVTSSSRCRSIHASTSPTVSQRGARQRPLDVLRLPAVPVRRHDHAPGDLVGDLGPVLLAHDVQAGVDAGGGARRGDHRALVDVQHVRLDDGPRDSARASSSACRQCVVQRRPSSSPAAPSTKAPEHTLSTRAPRSTARRSASSSSGGIVRASRTSRRPGRRSGRPPPAAPGRARVLMVKPAARVSASGPRPRPTAKSYTGSPSSLRSSAEDLADDAEFEGMHTVEEDGGHVFQHAASVPRSGSNSMVS